MLSWRGVAPSSPGMTIPPTGVYQQPPQNTSMTDVFTHSLIIFTPSVSSLQTTQHLQGPDSKAVKNSGALFENAGAALLPLPHFSSYSSILTIKTSIQEYEEITVIRFEGMHGGVNLLLPLWGPLNAPRGGKGGRIRSHLRASHRGRKSRYKWRSGSHPLPRDNCDVHSHLKFPQKMYSRERSALRETK